MIILAGFMWKLPERIVQTYAGRIVNIHPALLPAYGGKGMYGHHVHDAVLAAGDKESGITIHYVNEEYDKGNIIMQARCQVLPTDSPDDLAARIHKLEHFYYPRVIDFLLPDRL
jgi:phosphoribosylglycinamide formyltransferase-1